MAISLSIGRTSKSPSAVNTAQSMKVTVMVVSMAMCSRSWSRAPKCWAITTPAPTEKPLKKNTSMFTIIVVAPTAARASLPTKLPTTTLSTVLYSI